MRYIPPRDALLATDPYVDENPTAGISGSVVPAAVFNWAMNEIVDVINAAAMTPADVLQLKDAIIALVIANAPVGGGGGVLPSRLISTATGLAGGGDLSADRTISLDFPALTAEESLNLAHVMAIHNGTAHRKITLSALASLLASSVVSQDTHAKTILASPNTANYTHTFTPATFPVTDRVFATFNSNGTTGFERIEVEMNSVWTTIHSVAGESGAYGGSGAVGHGCIGVAYNHAVGKLFKLTPANPSGMAGTSYPMQSVNDAMPWKAEHVPGVWSGKLRSYGGGICTSIYKLAPATLA